jgi:hypothetical protein
MSLWEAVGEQVAAFTLLLSEAVRRSPLAYLSPLGVGAFDLSQKGLPRGYNQFGLYLDAASFDRRFDRRFSLQPDWLPFSEITPIREQLQADFPQSWENFWKNGWAFVAPAPVLQAATGDQFLTNTSVGTFGAEVSWSSLYGLLTAGHVGGAVSTAVNVLDSAGNLQQVGSVVFSQSAAGAGPQGGADVALIELNSKPAGSWGGRQKRTVKALDDIDVLCSTGSATAKSKGMFAWLAYPGTNIVFANTYMTDKAITTQGDSGARAVEKSSGDVVGHVVGATIKVASYIQEIDYQLNVIKSHAQFSGIAL